MGNYRDRGFGHPIARQLTDSNDSDDMDVQKTDIRNASFIKDQSPVESRMNDIRISLASLNANLTELIHQLEPVLPDEKPVDSDNNALYKDVNDSRLVRDLDSVLSRIDAMTGQVCDARDHLQI